MPVSRIPAVPAVPKRKRESGLFENTVRTGGTSAYAGIASSFLDLDGGPYNDDENGQSHLFFGVDYYMDYNFYLNVEAHLFGQDMLNIGVGYEF